MKNLIGIDSAEREVLGLRFTFSEDIEECALANIWQTQNAYLNKWIWRKVSEQVFNFNWKQNSSTLTIPLDAPKHKALNYDNFISAVSPISALFF